MGPWIALLILLFWSAPALAQDLVVPSDRVTSFVHIRSLQPHRRGTGHHPGRLDLARRRSRLAKDAKRWRWMSWWSGAWIASGGTSAT
jgi:hypothetical protein